MGVSNTAQTLAIIGVVVTLMGVIVGIQSFWIARAFARIEKRLDRIEDAFLQDIRGRIARLEGR